MKYNSKSRSKSPKKSGDLNLPREYPWKVLSCLLKDLSQYLTAEDTTRLEKIIRERDLTGYLALAKDWGLQSIASDGALLEEIRAKYQLAALLKKYQFPSNRETCELAAKEKFLEGEARCLSFNREGWKKLAMETREWKVNAITYAKAFLQKIFGVVLPEMETLLEWSRHGPGATLSTKAGLISSYFKFSDWPYQCTAAAYRYAKEAIRSDARWLGALEDSYRTRFNIPKHAILNRKRFWNTVLQIVPGDRICFVPKGAEEFRTITIGPTLNIYLQLGVDGYARRRLRRWGIDLNSQKKNQELARIGSLGGEDPFVTLDVRNASNSVAKKLCEYLLPDEWYFYLLQLRSHQCEFSGESPIYLAMMSSMGNGYTFVLESAIFASLIYGVMKAIDGKYDAREFAVFGDDLVVRQHLAEPLIELLADCNFEINREKSFLSGPVRESCGYDWFEGRALRPVFLDHTPTDVKELLTDINRLKRILSLRWGLEESLTEKRMVTWIPEIYRDSCGPYSDEDFDSYLHSAGPLRRYKRGVWEYTRVVYRPQKVSAKDFLFRKLMHNLRDAPAEPSFIKRRKLEGSGSRFAVYRRNAETVSKTTSATSVWLSEYTELMP